MSQDPETLYESPWLGLYRIGTWDFVRRPKSNACAGILAVTPHDEIILIEQFRIPIGRRVIEIPAGIVGDEEEFAHESIAETARRELLEETGYHAENIQTLLVSPTSAGMSSEFTHLFLATGLTRQQEGGGVHGEEILTWIIPRSEVRNFLKQKEADGLAIDFKIHAALWAAGF